MLAKFTSRILTAVFVILLANHLLPTSFGIYNLAFSIAYITAVVMDFGFDEMTIREVSRRPDSTGRILSTVLLGRGILLFVNFGILALIYALFVPWVDTEMTLTVLLLAGSMLVMEKITGSFSAVFQAHERMDIQGMIELVSKGIYLGIGFTAIYMGMDLKGILTLLLISYILHFAISLISYTFVLEYRFDKPTDIYGSVKTTFPFTIFVLLAVFYGHIIILLLTILEGDYATGVYSASWKIVVFLGVVPYSFGRALYPVFSKMYEKGKSKLERTYSRSMKYLLISALPITILLYLITDMVLGLIYHEDFIATAPVFRTMVWILPFLFMNGSLKVVLWASDRTSKASVNLFISSATLVVVGAVMIPNYGVTGAAAAVVLAEMVHFVLNYHIVSDFLRPLPLSYLWKPFLASLIMASVIILPGMPALLPYTLTLSVLAYFVILYMVGGLDKQDLTIVREIFWERA